MRKLEWSPDALEDLDIIWMYIAEDSVERASTFVEELQAQARKLIDAPRTGVVIPEINDEMFRKNTTRVIQSFTKYVRMLSEYMRCITSIEFSYVHTIEIRNKCRVLLR